MARQITDVRQGTVSVPLHKFPVKWLVIGIIIACVIGGGIVGGNLVFNKATPTAQNQPVQPNPIPPVTQTPVEIATPATNSVSVINAIWKEIQLPKIATGFGYIEGFKVENGGQTIFVWRCLGPADDGKATRMDLWKSEDGGKSWKEIEQMVVYDKDYERLGLIKQMATGGWGPWTAGSLLNEEEIHKQPDSLMSEAYRPGPTAIDEEGNLILVFVRYPPFDGNLENKYKPYDVYRLFLSTDNKKSWKQLNFPPRFSYLDPYPETPELTLLRDNVSDKPDYIWGRPSDIALVKIANSDDGSVSLFLVSQGQGFFKGTIKSPD